MQNLTEKIDELFAQNKGQEAQELMQDCLKEALHNGNLEDAVPILNELIGYCRETSQVQQSYEYADLVLRIMGKLKLEGSIPYATTLLNIANAYRAGGRLEDSLNLYQQVEDIYKQCLEPEDMLVASLFNNKSLLYQEMGSFEKAKETLLKAFAIVEKREDTVFEVAVTFSNLASTCLSLGQDDEAVDFFTNAIQLFEENKIFDTHYCAALSALGTYQYGKGDYKRAEQTFLKAMEGIEQHLGRNEYYDRMRENAEVCRQAAEKQSKKMQVQSSHVVEMKETVKNPEKGLDICRAYYEQYGLPMLQREFPEYLDRIAVGLVGEGSDCFGLDDEISRDHDWGPGFCLWVTDETYEEIGEKLQKAYEALPREFEGYIFKETVRGQKRRGVHTISGFYKRLLGEDNFSKQVDLDCLKENIKWEKIEDYALAAVVNGQVFKDSEGIFTAVRNLLQSGYPEKLRYLKIAQASARFCQNGQYNVPRMLKRGDQLAARLLTGKAVEEALKLLYYVDGRYPIHDKWLIQGVKQNGKYLKILGLIEKVMVEDITKVSVWLEKLAEELVQLLYRKHYISDTESYLEGHVDELLFKAGIAEMDVAELAESIARLEFKAFDRVKNLGGRADCQDDWFTFSIMRRSQYLTWNHQMLLQYYYDFTREFEQGHNLIEEKYGRMMESTAPAEYAVIKELFPVIDDRKRAIIETIVNMQVKWMEEFAEKYPYLAGNARSIHTYEDNLWNTSYETYLRGELCTYSDKMLQLYGQYIVELATSDRNPAEEIMKHSVLMYGYEGLKEAEEGLKIQS